MSQAQDREAKEYVVLQVKHDETFAEIAAQYEAAKYAEKHGDITSSSHPPRPRTGSLMTQKTMRAHKSITTFDNKQLLKLKTLIHDHEEEEEVQLVEGMKSTKIHDRAIMWKKRSDEIEELKKIFFEFLKNSCERKE